VNRRFKPIIFSEVAESLRKEWAQKVKNRELSEITDGGYNLRLNIIEEIFGKRLLIDISEEDIIEYRNALSINVSNATSNRNLFVIKQVFAMGLRQKALRHDPSSSIKYLSEKEHERNNFILPPGIEGLVEASQRTRAKFYMPALIFLGAEHGAARQEALSLKWPQIDFDFNDHGLITLYRKKNKRKRTAFLMPRTKQALLDWRAHLEWMRHRKRINPNGNDFAFCRLDGTPIGRFDSAWRHTCKLAGMDDFHYHDLRHTFASNLLLSGSDIKDVKEMIGHSDLKMTDRYSHLTLDHQGKNQKRLAEYYSNGALQSL